MAKNSFYAVLVGRQPGIYTNWDDAKAQVEGFSGAKHQKFKTEEEAIAYMSPTVEGDKSIDYSKEPEVTLDSVQAGIDSRLLFAGIDGPIAYVDGSYDSKSQQYAYGVVIIPDATKDEEIHLSGKGDDPMFVSQNNVAGEMHASMAAMRYARENGYDRLTIFHDYQGLASWCQPANGQKQWKANTPATQFYKSVYDETVKTVDISFVKVKGHSGDYYNDIVDGLAKRELGVPVMKRVEEKLQPNTSRGHEFDDMIDTMNMTTPVTSYEGLG